MSLGRVVVHDVDDDVLAYGDIHHGPRLRMILTTVETYVEPLVCHYHGKDRGVSWSTRTGETVWWTRSKEMESIGCRDKPYSDNGYS